MAILQRRRRGAHADDPDGGTEASAEPEGAEPGAEATTEPTVPVGRDEAGRRRRRRERSGRRRDRKATDAHEGPATTVVVAPAAPVVAPEATTRERQPFSLRTSWPVLLVQAAHPKQGLLMAAGLAVAAALSGRPQVEVAVVFLTVLVGQTILGWHNDLVDRKRDARHEAHGKPIARGLLDADLVWFSLAIAVALVVPLSISTGVTAGGCYLLSVAIGVIGNSVQGIRRHALSWLTWVLAFALYPAYLSYGGWGGGAEGSAPTAAMTVLAGLLGLGVHFMRSVFGLVADNEDHWTYLPLKLGLKVGATRLLLMSGAFTVLVLAGMAVVSATVGLST